MDKSIDKLLARVNSVSAAAEKYSTKYGADRKYKYSSSNVSELSRYANKMYSKVSSNLESMTKHSMQVSSMVAKKTLELSSSLAQETIKVTKDSLQQMTSELSQDFSINVKNVLAQSMARNMPIFGYALTRAVNTEVVKKLASYGAEKTKVAASHVGEFIKEKFTEGKDKLTHKKEELAKKKKEHDLIKKIEGIVPKLAVGGYMKKDALIKAHRGEIVAPVDKILEPLQQIAKDIHILITDFRRYLKKTSNVGGSSEFMTPELAGLTRRQKIEKMKEMGSTGIGKFMEIFFRRQLTSLSTFVKSSYSKDNKSLIKAFFSAYRQVNEDYEAPWQERMLRATLEMRTALVGNTNRWKMISEAMLAQSATYRTIVASYKTLKSVVSMPFKATYSFFKARGGYQSKLPRNKTAQEATALTLGSIYVDFLTKYDYMLENQNKMIELMSGGSEQGVFNYTPPIWSFASKLGNFFDGIKKFTTGVAPKKKGPSLLEELTTEGLGATVSRRLKERGRRLAKEREYVAGGPRQTMTLLQCCQEQVFILRKIRTFLLNRFGTPQGGKSTDYYTDRESQNDIISKQRKLTPKQRAQLLFKEKLRFKLGIPQLRDTLDRARERNIHRDAMKSLDKRQLRKDVFQEYIEQYKTSKTEWAGGSKIKRIFTKFGDMKNRMNPIIILDNIRTFTKHTWEETKRTSKYQNKFMSLLRNVFMFGFNLVKNMFGKFKGLLGGGLTSLLGSRIGLGGLMGAPGLLMGGYDAYKGVKKAKEWGVHKVFAGIGGFLGGTGKGAMNALKGVTKGVSIGSMIGTAIAPGLGTAIGGAVGAIAGGLLGLIGGENIAKFMSFIGEKIKALAKGVLAVVMWPFKAMWKLAKKAGGWLKKKFFKVEKTIWEKITDLIPDFVKDAGKKIISVVKTPFNYIIGLFHSIWPAIKAWVKDKLGKIPIVGSYIKKAFEKTKETATGAVTTAAIKGKDYVTSKYKGAKDAYERGKEYLKERKRAYAVGDIYDAQFLEYHEHGMKDVLKDEAIRRREQSKKYLKEKARQAKEAIFGHEKRNIGDDLSPADRAAIAAYMAKERGTELAGTAKLKLLGYENRNFGDDLSPADRAAVMAFMAKEKGQEAGAHVLKFFQGQKEKFKGTEAYKEWLKLKEKVSKSKTAQKSKELYEKTKQRTTLAIKGHAVKDFGDDLSPADRAAVMAFMAKEKGKAEFNKIQKVGAAAYIQEKKNALMQTQTFEKVKKAYGQVTDTLSELRELDPRYKPFMPYIISSAFDAAVDSDYHVHKNIIERGIEKLKKNANTAYTSGKETYNKYIDEAVKYKENVEKNGFYVPDSIKSKAKEAYNATQPMQQLIKIEADKLILTTKMTGTELAKITSKNIQNLAKDTKEAIGQFSQNVVNHVTNVQNTVSTQNNNMTSQQAMNEIDGYVQALLVGDIQ